MADCEQDFIMVGDIGTAMKIKVIECDDSVDPPTSSIVDLSTATEMRIIFIKPDKIPVVKTAVFTTDGTDGYMEYINIGGDVDQAGTWKKQGWFRMPSGEWYTSYESYKVKEPLTTVVVP